MLDNIEIPHEFGGSWEAFQLEWCCGSPLGYSAADTSRGLCTIWRLWPKEVTRRARESLRGTAVAAQMVELGLLLATSETTDGFSKVFKRLSNGERSAYSELVLAASLQRLGHPVSLEPSLDGRVLDATSVIDELSVFFEVVAPDRSEVSAEDQRVANTMTTVVHGRVSKCRVEIELHTPLGEESIADIVTAIEEAKPGTWVRVDPVARIRRIDAGQPLVTTFDGGGAQIVTGGERAIQGESTTVISRWESSDVRAKRVFNDEYHQFSQTVANVLVVNVCAVPDGMKLWPVEMKRLLQPARNRKVGAVVFFEQGTLGPPEAIHRRWRVLVNSHAHIQIPERLLAGFESLDESEAYGLPRPARMLSTV